MRYFILATDYDGTLALHGIVSPSAIASIKKVKASGRKIILVTGRELEELQQLFPDFILFDLIVAENGALVFDPATKHEFTFGDKPPVSFLEELNKMNVEPLSVGRVIVATWEPHQATVLEAIKHAGIEHQVIFNKGAIMILPPGVNKATGLHQALKQLKFSMHNVVAIGDAENDNAMLQAAECSVAVANALDSVKQAATIVTRNDHGEGVSELIDRLIDNDLADIEEEQQKFKLLLGKRSNNTDFTISPYHRGILLAGPSGEGKSTFTTAFMESLLETGYQFCIIDPEGDYFDFPGTVVLGNAEQEPVMEEIITLIENPKQNLVICILAVSLDKRPAFFNTLFAQLNDQRLKTGHPHWLIFDEANHMLPVETESSFFNIPGNLNNFMLITTSPAIMNKAIMNQTNMVIALGENAAEIFNEYAVIKNIQPVNDVHAIERGYAWVWDTGRATQPFIISTRQPEHLNRRHIRKYATGNMEGNNFYFRGPEGKLNLNAYNVMVFMQLAKGVDDETWMFHLREHAYSKWFREALHDEELASLSLQIENEINDPVISKSKILELIEKRYTVAG